MTEIALHGSQLAPKRMGNPAWRPGVSGNPSGRPKRPDAQTLTGMLKLRIAEEPGLIVDQLIAAVKRGEGWAIQYAMDRVEGKMPTVAVASTTNLVLVRQIVGPSEAVPLG